MSASFCIGLEFGQRDKLAKRTDEYFVKQEDFASPLLQMSFTPLDNVGLQLFAEWLQSGKITKERAQAEIKNL